MESNEIKIAGTIATGIIAVTLLANFLHPQPINIAPMAFVPIIAGAFIFGALTMNLIFVIFLRKKR